MWWELCEGSSECLKDLYGDGNASWQKAKSFFRNKRWFGNYLLIHRARNGNFKLYRINIK